MKRFFLLLFPLLAAALTSHAQTRSFNPSVNADGITYALPRTLLRIDATATQIRYQPGDFARYANRYLHIENVSTEATVEYALQTLSLTSFGQPDTSKVYTVAFNAKTVLPNVTLSEDGLLLSVNDPEGVKPAATAADGRTAAASSRSRVDGRRFLTEEIQSATSTAKMAELTASLIYELRDTRNDLLRGDAENMPTDGEGLRLRLKGLQEQEEALMSLFIGRRDTTSLAESFVFEPTKDTDKHILFRFSKWNGFVDADDLSGEPYYLSIADKRTVEFPTPEQLKKRKLDGLVYNLPSQAVVTLSSMDKTIISSQLPIAQFGIVDQLPVDMLKKNSSIRVRLSPASGALLQVQQ